jgi:hypothetical protein
MTRAALRTRSGSATRFARGMPRLRRRVPKSYLKDPSSQGCLVEGAESHDRAERLSGRQCRHWSWRANPREREAAGRGGGGLRLRRCSHDRSVQIHELGHLNAVPGACGKTRAWPHFFRAKRWPSRTICLSSASGDRSIVANPPTQPKRSKFQRDSVQNQALHASSVAQAPINEPFDHIVCRLLLNCISWSSPASDI